MYIRLNSFSSLNSVESKPNIKKKMIANEVFLEIFNCIFGFIINWNNEKMKIEEMNII